MKEAGKTSEQNKSGSQQGHQMNKGNQGSNNSGSNKSSESPRGQSSDNAGGKTPEEEENE